MFFFSQFSDVAWPAIIFWCEIHNKRWLLFLKMQQSKKFRVPDRQIQTVFLNMNHWNSSAGFNRQPKTKRTLNSFYFHILFVAKFRSIILWARNLKTYPKKMQTLLLKHCPTCRNCWKMAPKTKTYEKMWQLFRQNEVVLMKIWWFFPLKNREFRQNVPFKLLSSSKFC